LPWKLYNREWGEVLTECEQWRRRYWEGSVRRSMIQTRQCQSVLYCGVFHSQNTFVCICVRHKLVLFAVLLSVIFRVSYLLNQNNTNSLQNLELLAFPNDILTRSSTTCRVNRLPNSHYCPLLPIIARTVFLPLLFSFVSICMTETCIVMDWLLWIVSVLIITARFTMY